LKIHGRSLRPADLVRSKKWSTNILVKVETDIVEVAGANQLCSARIGELAMIELARQNDAAPVETVAGDAGGADAVDAEMAAAAAAADEQLKRTQHQADVMDPYNVISVAAESP
jgi:hypothetical protein